MLPFFAGHDRFCPLTSRIFLAAFGLTAALVTAGGTAHANPLIEAARRGDSGEVRTLIQAGADLNVAASNGLTPLLAAIFNGNTTEAALLIEAGAELGIVPLDSGVLRQLGADIEVDGKIQATPLMAAVFADSFATVERLLDAGADVSQRTDTGLTPLSMAAAHNREAMASLFLDRGADVNHADGSGRTALHVALEQSNTDLATVFIRAGADPNTATEEGVTALTLATASGDVPLAEAAIKAGASIDARVRTRPEIFTRDPEGSTFQEPGLATALMVAAATAEHDVAKALLELGADVNAAGANGLTPLLLAINRENDSMALFLIEAGAEVDVADDDGITPLLAAVEKAGPGLVQTLIAAGADVNEPASNGRTPLVAALEAANSSIVQMLVNAGANVSAAGVAGNASPVDTVGFDPDYRSFLVDPFVADLIRRRLDLRGLAFHPDSQRLYWTEFARSRIRHATSAGTEVQTLQADRSPAQRPIGLALTSDHILWTTDGSYPRSVLIAPLDGGAVEAVVTGRFVNRPSAIAVTASARKQKSSEQKTSEQNNAGQTVPEQGNAEQEASDQEASDQDGSDQDASKQEVYWTESISGRIRRADFEGSDVEELLSSGISSVQDRDDFEVLVAHGLAIDEESAQIYWTEVATPRLRRATLDGTEVEDVLTEADGLDFPMGIAIDAPNKKLYWADLVRSEIARANLDGSNVEILLDSSDGLVTPNAIAIDPKGGHIFWTDSATDTIHRANLDGASPEKIFPASTDSLGTSCSDVATRNLTRFARLGFSTIQTCLRKVDATKAVKRSEQDARAAVRTCARQLARIGSADLTAEYDLEISRACSATTDRKDAEQSAKESSHPARALLSRCGATATETPIETTETWLPCLWAQARRATYQTIGVLEPRTREWLQELRPFLAKTPDEARDPKESIEEAGERQLALTVLDQIHAALEKPSAATVAERIVAVTATGQTTSYRAVASQSRHRSSGDASTSDAPPLEDPSADAPTSPPPSAFMEIPDDGAVRAGPQLRFTDNGDGTITDNNTGLMWEKKCDCREELHDFREGYPWENPDGQRTVADWLRDINDEAASAPSSISPSAATARTDASKVRAGTDEPRGFAGYSDWRIPAVHELLSIVDFERFNPAVDIAFDAASCGLGCNDTTEATCSCTAMSSHWTSTPLANTAGRSFVVTMNLGLIGDETNRESNNVRAVRTVTAP